MNKKEPNIGKHSFEKEACVIGSFAAGVASGVGGSAVAVELQGMDTDEVLDLQTEKSANVNVEDEPIVSVGTVSQSSPAPEEALVATDEGIRIAQVDDNVSFATAFADARAQVGPGGAFEWKGHVYNTFYEEEWNSMSSAERAQYQSRIDYNAIIGNELTSEHIVSHNSMTSEVPIDTNSDDEGVRILGVEAVMDSDGNPMIVAGIEIDGEQALLVDVDNDGTMDVIMIDKNGNHHIDWNEMYDISDAQISTDVLMQTTEEPHDSHLFFTNDSGSDYMGDTDSNVFV